MNKENKFLHSCSKHGLDTEKIKEKLEQYDTINQMVRQENNPMINSAFQHASIT